MLACLIIETTVMEFELERKWLHTTYQLVPGAKPMKVSFIKNALERNFSWKYEHKIISCILQEEFPTAENIYSSDRTMHIFGIEKVGEEPSTSTAKDDEERQHLKCRIQELEETEHRVRELEQLVCNTSPSVLTTQVDRLLHSNMAVYHGPNNITHFEEFSLDAISAEIKQNAPALFQMFRALCHNVSQ